MNELTRRHIFAGAAAVTTAGALAPITPSAQAAAPPTGRQAPSFYRCKVGELEVTVAGAARPTIAVMAPRTMTCRRTSNDARICNPPHSQPVLAIAGSQWRS
jgi:hypothetical protein